MSILTNLVRLGSRHAPSILAGVGVAGVVSTAYLAARGGSRMTLYIQDHPELSEADWKEKFGVAWRMYGPAVVAGVGTIVAVVCGQTVMARRYAALGAAYSVSAEAYERYKDAVRESVPEATRSEIAEKAASKVSVPTTTVVLGDGNILCFDAYSGRKFLSDLETIRRVENDLQRDLNNGESVSLNEYYSAVGLEPTALGDQLGWKQGGRVEFGYSSKIDSNGQPALVVDFVVEPREDWFKLGR